MAPGPESLHNLVFTSLSGSYTPSLAASGVSSGKTRPRNSDRVAIRETFSCGPDLPSNFTGPSAFGSGGISFASSSSGDAFYFDLDDLYVPLGYVSGSSIAMSGTYAGHTFMSLGLTPGTYVWTLGSGMATDTFTINVQSAAVPEPTALSLALVAGAVAGFRMRRRKPAA